jgi:hypothetical protein
MSNAEKLRLSDIEDRLRKQRHILEGMIPIWSQVDRKVKSLQLEIERLEEERSKLVHGQTVFDFSNLKF